MPVKVLVLGKHGQLSRAINDSVNEFPDITFQFLASKDIDFCDPDRVRRVLDEVEFDHLINTAAFTQVDLAETECDQALQINATIVKLLAQVSEQRGAGLWQISTDYVFGDYHGDEPIIETEPVSPVNYYAETKYRGECLALDYCSRARIIRTSGLHYPGGKNFVATMLRLADQHKELKVVDDQVTCPTNAGDLAQLLLSLIVKEAPDNIYHVVNSNPLSWYQFAVEIFKKYNKPVRVVPIPSSDYPLPAKRPRYSGLSNMLVRDYLDTTVRSSVDSLPRYP